MNKEATENKGTKMQLLHKPDKNKLVVLGIVFAWIALWNIIFQACHHLWEDSPIQIVNWAFFIAVTIYFMQEELSYKERFWHTLVGGAVGLLLAAGIVKTYGMMYQAGVYKLVAICIPLLIAIGALILLKPMLPMFFNNVGFCYLIIAFVNKEEAVSSLPSYLLSLLLGSIILNLCCGVFITQFVKMKKKKAIAAAKLKAAQAAQNTQ